MVPRSTPIDGATATTYTLINDDVSSQISYQETRTRPGYVPLVSASGASATITGGVITLAKPTISGSPVVDQVLTATAGAVSPDATISYVWQVDGSDAGTGPTYLVKPADVDHAVTVVATATRTDYDPTSAISTATSPVTRAAFTTGPTASFSGVLRVGETLTADGGTASPAPDSLRYQWSADGEPITGATASTFDLTRAQKDRAIAVTVTAVRAGYVDASDESDASAPVVTNLAPA